MTINNMKKKYISPETAVFVCNTNSLLMASKLDVLDDNLSVIPTDDEFDGEFSSRDLDIEDVALDF
ncbi:hypothetical protein SAMN06298211_11535 [Prevotellaceae bacterium MN60]|jgi:hypothetical protein|nr:hypothetical protein SAMN02910409_0518 [Prevotellaceae bacterium HUN156]SNU05623.1 hypothetical protein SAMN06298211_11535 [Prevotellaceae bacterium MN60]